MTRAWNPSAVRETGFAVDGAGLDLDAARARHQAAQPGDRKAALPSLLHVVANCPDFRVDEDRRRDLGMLVGFRNPVGEEPKTLRDLRRRQSDALLLDHRAHHGAAEVREAAASEPVLRDLIRNRSQNRMTQSDDLEQVRVLVHQISRSRNIHPSCSRWSVPGHWGSRR